MSCSILTTERIEALLAGQLSGPERAAVAEHLRSRCASCLEALGSVEGERILAALCGPSADLSAAEASRVFEAATPRAGGTPQREEQPGFLERVIAWLGGATWRPALGIAVLLLVAAPAILMSQPEGPSSAGGYDGIKAGSRSLSPAKANLIGVVGARFHGKPFVARRVTMREQLRPGEALLLRFRLDSSAAVHLQLSGPKASLGVWADGRADSEPQPVMLPAGEHALVADRQVLPIQTQKYGSPLRVTLITSPTPFPDGFAFASLSADPQALNEACPECALDVLEVLPPPEGLEPEESFR